MYQRGAIFPMRAGMLPERSNLLGLTMKNSRAERTSPCFTALSVFICLFQFLWLLLICHKSALEGLCISVRLRDVITELMIVYRLYF